MSELKKCPFCGGSAMLMGDGHWIACEHCLSESDCYNTKEEAIQAWNRRKPVDDAVQEVKRYQLQYESGLGGFTDELVDRVLRNVIEIVKEHLT